MRLPRLSGLHKPSTKSSPNRTFKRSLPNMQPKHPAPSRRQICPHLWLHENHFPPLGTTQLSSQLIICTMALFLTVENAHRAIFLGSQTISLFLDGRQHRHPSLRVPCTTEREMSHRRQTCLRPAFSLIFQSTSSTNLCPMFSCKLDFCTIVIKCS
jgi:hypothetical protein